MKGPELPAPPRPWASGAHQLCPPARAAWDGAPLGPSREVAETHSDARASTPVSPAKRLKSPPETRRPAHAARRAGTGVPSRASSPGRPRGRPQAASQAASQATSGDLAGGLAGDLAGDLRRPQAASRAAWLPSRPCPHHKRHLSGVAWPPTRPCESFLRGAVRLPRNEIEILRSTAQALRSLFLGILTRPPPSDTPRNRGGKSSLPHTHGACPGRSQSPTAPTCSGVA